MDKMIIRRDTREKENKGYYWEENDWCEGYVTEKIETGDYTIVGLEDKVCIERKNSTAELSKNISEDRFYREMERMALIPHSFIICEFTLEDILNFPINSGIPQKRWKWLKITSKILLKRITEIQIKYGIKVIFCGNKENAWQMVNSIFKRVIGV